MNHEIIMSRRRYLLLFVVVSTVFFAIRSTEGLVWNDSPQTAENLYGFQDGLIGPATGLSICRDQGGTGLRWESPALTAKIFQRAFSCLEFGGYRPLSAALSFFGVATFSEVYDRSPPKAYLGTLWTLGVACLFGLLAVLLFSISSEYIQSKWAGCLVLILFFFSPAMVSGAWILFSGGIQVTVPLCICLGIWIYKQTVKAEKHRWIWEGALCLTLFLGPWVREYVGLVAILVIILELQQYRRVTRLVTFGLFGFAHAVFPTALMHLALPHLPVVPVFKLGSLAVQLQTLEGGTSIRNLISSVKWDVPKVFLALLPPSFLLLSGFGWLTLLKRNRRTLLALSALVVVLLLTWGKPWFWLTLVLGFSGVSLLQSVSSAGRLGQIIFLNIWFLLSLLPFLKVFSAHVHLAYPLIPGLILLVASTERFLKKAILVPVLTLCLIDQMLNAYGSYVTVTSLNRGVKHMARWFTDNTPAGSIVIANALHAEDIRLYSQNHILPYWSVGVGVPPERTLEKPEEIRQFLANNFGNKPIFLLNITQEFASHKGGYHAHKYVVRKTVQTESLGEVFAISASFPFLDPLRLLFPRHQRLFLGPPDLENDFYFGPDQSKRLFFNEVAVAYEVYKVIDPKVSLSADLLPDSTFFFPQFLKTYRGFQLFGYRDKFVALANGISLNDVHLPPALDKNVVADSSLKNLETRIDSFSVEP